MTKYFLAKAVKGKEFLYSKMMMIAVPTSSANKIADVLNAKQYRLKPNETWWVYENDWYSNDYITHEIKRYDKRSMRLVSYGG